MRHLVLSCPPRLVKYWHGEPYASGIGIVDLYPVHDKLAHLAGDGDAETNDATKLSFGFKRRCQAFVALVSWSSNTGFHLRHKRHSYIRKFQCTTLFLLPSSSPIFPTPDKISFRWDPFREWYFFDPHWQMPACCALRMRKIKGFVSAPANGLRQIVKQYNSLSIIIIRCQCLTA
jgi:hypothetical protein